MTCRGGAGNRRRDPGGMGPQGALQTWRGLDLMARLPFEADGGAGDQGDAAGRGGVGEHVARRDVVAAVELRAEAERRAVHSHFT